MIQSTIEHSPVALQYLIREPGVKSDNRRAIILLHGVGSNEADLFRFSDQFSEDLYVISPRGPVTLGAGRYGWYNVDFSTGKPVVNYQQEQLSRNTILDFIRQVKQLYNLREVYLGGFSQGGIMSYSIGLTHPDEVNGVLSLSGRLLDEIKPLVRAGDSLRRLRVFIAHGTDDRTLPLAYAQSAKQYLESLGVRLTYQEYIMGHEINSQVLKDMIKWI
jgi:phospholipase/carboxylesterase